MHTRKIENPTELASAKRLLYRELFAPLGLSEDTQERLKIPGVEHYFICEVDNQTVGVMVLSVDQDRVELHHAAVSKAYRNLGIGKRLWNEVYDFAKKIGITGMELYSRNTAIEFWTSCGFQASTEEWIEAEPFVKHGIRHKRMELQIR